VQARGHDVGRRTFFFGVAAQARDGHAEERGEPLDAEQLDHRRPFERRHRRPLERESELPERRRDVAGRLGRPAEGRRRGLADPDLGGSCGDRSDDLEGELVYVVGQQAHRVHRLQHVDRGVGGLGFVQWRLDGADLELRHAPYPIRISSNRHGRHHGDATARADSVGSPTSFARSREKMEPMDGSNDPDEEALDAYSRVVTSVAERLIPSVASLQVRARVRGARVDGAGSGVVITPTGSR
jgi:hypothetical protein